MTWSAIDNQKDVHVVPNHDDHPHILSEACECTPVIKVADEDGPFERPLIVHRDELDRLDLQ